MTFIALILFSLNPLASAQMTPVDGGKCLPNYQLFREECVATDEVISRKEEIKRVKVVEGACEVADPNAYCSEASQGKRELAASYPGVKLDDLRTVSADTETALGKFCGQLPKIKEKVDIYCTFKFDVPQFKKVASDTCPIVDAEDVNNCFPGENAHVDEDYIEGCLRMQPKSEMDWWTKGACLLDYYDDVGNFRVQDASFDRYKRAESQLRIIEKRTAASSSPSLKNLAKKIREKIR